MTNDPFIAVHLGAGKHSAASEKALRKLSKTCCRVGMQLLKEGKSSQVVAVEVCKMLENSALTNSGYGSQLNFDGVVECDASLMESSKGLGASVGAITGVSNPIEVAACILNDLQSGDRDVLGRVWPVMLVGNGAENYARKNGIETGKDLISPAALAYFLKWRELYKKIITSTSSETMDTLEDEDLIQDTVGVVCVDANGIVSVATSSGGVTLKTPGRVGPAGMLRAGINISRNDDSIRAVCLSGTGEDIIQSQLGLDLCEVLFSETDINQYLSRINRLHSFQREPLYFGVLGVCVSKGVIDLVYVHTTEAFVVAYQMSDSPAVVEISRNGLVGGIALGGSTYRGH